MHGKRTHSARSCSDFSSARLSRSLWIGTSSSLYLLEVDVEAAGVAPVLAIVDLFFTLRLMLTGFPSNVVTRIELRDVEGKVLLVAAMLEKDRSDVCTKSGAVVLGSELDCCYPNQT